MTVAELIDVLQNYNQDSEVLVSDGINRYHIQYETITEMNLDSNLEPMFSDCDEDDEFVVIGESY
tara:strand:+ start:1093 stop:1287 length:195 start_codon:yes stop_codon:yes gene_type:complete